ncbi:MAG: MFS transporter, partial [Candidatus Aenigmatarchaeota archaeon]
LNFSVTFSSPFLSVYLVTNKGGSIINVAIISVISAITFIIFSRPWGRTLDKIGPKIVFYVCIIPISFLPSIYVISPKIEWIYVYEVVASLGWTGFNIATFTYLTHAVPREKLDSSIGFYNLIVGLGSSVGPVVGGIVSEKIGLGAVLLISTFLRILSLIFINKLEEEEMKFKYRGDFDTRGFMYRIENLVSTYSILIRETLGEGLKVLEFTNSLTSSFRKVPKQQAQKSSKRNLKVGR